jgi:hypothetical protein
MGQECYKRKEKYVYNKVSRHVGVKFGKLNENILALEMDFLHRSTGISRREKIRNEIITENGNKCNS